MASPSNGITVQAEGGVGCEEETDRDGNGRGSYPAREPSREPEQETQVCQGPGPTTKNLSPSTRFITNLGVKRHFLVLKYNKSVLSVTLGMGIGALLSRNT